MQILFVFLTKIREILMNYFSKQNTSKLDIEYSDYASTELRHFLIDEICHPISSYEIFNKNNNEFMLRYKFHIKNSFAFLKHPTLISTTFNFKIQKGNNGKILIYYSFHKSLPYFNPYHTAYNYFF